MSDQMKIHPTEMLDELESGPLAEFCDRPEAPA